MTRRCRFCLGLSFKNVKHCEREMPRVSVILDKHPTHMSTQAPAVYKVIFSKPQSVVIYFPRNALGSDLTAFLKDVLRPRYFWYATLKNPSAVHPLETLDGVGTWSSPSVILIATSNNRPETARKIAEAVAADVILDKPTHVISMSDRKQALDSFDEWASARPQWRHKSDSGGAKSLVSNIGSVLEKRKVKFSAADDVREFSKRASARAVSGPTKTMLRARRAQALQEMATRWISAEMQHPSGNPNLLYVKKVDGDARHYVLLRCPKDKQFEHLLRLRSWLPNVVEQNPDARSFVFDMSDLSPLPGALTVQTMQLLDGRNDWPGKFRLVDVAFSGTEKRVVGTPEWLLSLASHKDNYEQLVWYDVIQDLTGREFVYLNEVYFPIIGRNIAAIRKLDAIIADEKVKLNRELLETLERYQKKDENVHHDDMYL
jgi:hypothetical protein